MEKNKKNKDDYQRNMEFVELFTKYQKNIFFFIVSMVSNHSDAEDILQETAGDMWKMFDRYEPGTNFLNWSLTIAKFRVFKFRRSYKKFQILDDVLLEQLIGQLEIRDVSGDKHIALEGCLKRIDKSERELLNLHYQQGMTYRDIAKKYEYAERRMYTIMSRVHISLRDCIYSTLKLWKGTV